MIADTKGRLSVTAFFLLYPLGALPLVVIELINRRLYAVILFSLFAGFLGYITIPYYLDDLVQYFQGFETFQQINHKAIENFVIVQRGPVTYYLFLTLSSLGLSKQVIPFLALFTVVFLKLLIYRDITLRLQINHIKILCILLIIFLLSINFRSTVLGIRNYTAISILLYGIYQLFTIDKKSGWIYILLSPMIHSMTFIYIPIIIFALLVNSIKYLKPLLIISLLFYFIDIQNFVSLVTGFLGEKGLIDDKISVHLGSYVEGYWATEFIEDLSFKGKIFSMLMLLPYFLINILMLFFLRPETRIHTLLFLSTVFCNLLFSLPNLFGRYSILPMLIFVIIFAMQHKDLYYSLKHRFIAISLIFTFSIYFLAQVYNMRYIIAKSYPRMIYKTSAGVFNTEVTHDEYIINF